MDPVGDPRADARADEDAERVGPATYGSMLAADQVDDRAGGRGDPDHQVAGRGRDPQRDAHHDVHRRDLDEAAADPEQRGRRTPGADDPGPDAVPDRGRLWTGVARDRAEAVPSERRAARRRRSTDRVGQPSDSPRPAGARRAIVIAT